MMKAEIIEKGENAETRLSYNLDCKTVFILHDDKRKYLKTIFGADQYKTYFLNELKHFNLQCR